MATHQTPSFRWPEWYGRLETFAVPERRRSLAQLANTLIPYALLWVALVRSVQLGVPYGWTLLLAVPAAGLLVRIFILFHDCVHGSFFASPRVNAVVGHLCGTLVFTPFQDWRFTHLRHHATVANLDARGVGDITTLTVAEYRALPRWRRLGYRLYRHPLVLFGLGPLFQFLVRQRWPSRRVSRAAKRSVFLTDLLLAGVVLTAAGTIGLETYLKVQLPVLALAGAGGIWLFYLQHQFEGVHWARREEWSPLAAALEGSSYLRLPAPLAWLSGDIGLHHVHHLRPRIPNYRLRACYDAVPELRAKPPLAWAQVRAAPRLKLWDEAARRLVGFPPREG